MNIDMDKLFDANEIEIKEDVSNIDELAEPIYILIIEFKNIIEQ